MNKYEKNFEFEISLDEVEKLELEKELAVKFGLSQEEISLLELKKKSIDARGRKIKFVFNFGYKDHKLQEKILEKLPSALTKGPVIIVGSGPSGLFCAYQLALLGVSSIICERGKKVQDRRKDLKGLNQHGIIDENSNYCFGEGGAGTYSDGKLYTRSHKRGSIKDVLAILVGHGANADILTNARPHIGSNKLPKIITALRENLENCGVRFLFNSKVVDIFLESKKAKGVILENGEIILGKAVVFATGHSASESYEVLSTHGALLESKAFAMGVRVEHPQSLINAFQYKDFANNKILPPAYYSLAHTFLDKVGVFSFCMCPGGWIVPASTKKSGLVVNGMSLSKRDSKFANSGLVVSIPKFQDYKTGLLKQSVIEEEAMKASAGFLKAPSIKIKDFVSKRTSGSLPDTSYIPGICSADLQEILDSSGINISNYLREAIKIFDKKMPGFISEDAIMVGVESRTSSPVRIVRDEHTFECIGIKNLFPLGEGAGYAGGIMSAAIDGINGAIKIYERL